MKDDIRNDHPLRSYFAEAIHESLTGQLGINDAPEVEHYLGEMLVRFMHRDGLYAVKDATGRPVEEVAEMLAEGDVLLRADSFAREREVHRHIGDFLLFWSGLFPEHLPLMKGSGGSESILDPIQQGRYSYHVVSTFDHRPYEQESPLFRRLSDQFEEFRYGLSLVRTSFHGPTGKGWMQA